ncbi:MAG: prepilin-type N-terminal cleavage/methylation domain-containing protein [Gemmatimonadaceae bacterium]|nr:prepilin-type N-terminal cleavage/methylation domain-containing protein [Gemmatimonadaceae bacterium]
MARNKKGFTLIELLIVVVIIGILAAIAIPKFTNTKAKAYVSAMKADLRNLATAQEQYAADSAGNYKDVDATATATPAAVGGGMNFTPSPNVGLATTVDNTTSPKTWTTDATHASAPGVTCTMNINGTITGTGC